LREYIDGTQYAQQQTYLFYSSKDWTRPISRIQTYRISKDAFNLCGMECKLATHSMRKTFAWMIWEGSMNNLAVTSSVMGYNNVNSTMSYIDVDREAVTSLLKALES